MISLRCFFNDEVLHALPKKKNKIRRVFEGRILLMFETEHFVLCLVLFTIYIIRQYLYACPWVTNKLYVHFGLEV